MDPARALARLWDSDAAPGLKPSPNSKSAWPGNWRRPAFLALAPRGHPFFEKVFHYHAQNLMATFRVNTEQSFKDAALAIGRSRHVELFAIGMSDPVAYLTACKLRLIGLPAAS